MLPDKRITWIIRRGWFVGHRRTARARRFYTRREDQLIRTGTWGLSPTQSPRPTTRNQPRRAARAPTGIRYAGRVKVAP
jgi:hypothetical protein